MLFFRKSIAIWHLCILVIVSSAFRTKLRNIAQDNVGWAILQLALGHSALCDGHSLCSLWRVYRCSLALSWEYLCYLSIHASGTFRIQVISHGIIVALIELASQARSFSNRNNRTSCFLWYFVAVLLNRVFFLMVAHLASNATILSELFL